MIKDGVRVKKTEKSKLKKMLKMLGVRDEKQIDKINMMDAKRMNGGAPKVH